MKLLEITDEADDPIIWQIIVSMVEKGTKLAFDIENPNRGSSVRRKKGVVTVAEIVLMNAAGQMYNLDDPRPKTFRVLNCDYWERSTKRPDGTWFPPYRDDFQLFQTADAKYSIKTIDGVKTLLDK
jgi:hypothetical protein